MSGMSRCWRRWGWKLGLGSWLVIGGRSPLLIAQSAQITPDGTLGAASSVVTPNASGVDVISGGATRGDKLVTS